MNETSDNRFKQTFIGKVINKIKSYAFFEKILLIISIFTVVSIFVFTFTESNLRANSDYAIANTLAEEIVRSGEYFPSDWVCGQDLWVFFNHTIIAVLTLFMDDYLLMHSIAGAVFLILAILTYIYFCRRLMKSNAFLILIPLLFCGASEEYARVVLGQCAYLPESIYLFLIITLYVESVDENFQISSKPKFIILVSLIAFCGLSGVRSIQAYSLPLLGSVVLYYFIKHYTDSPEIFFQKSVPMVKKFICISMAIVVGYIGFKILIRQVHFSEGITGVNIIPGGPGETLPKFITLFVALFGASSAPLLSPAGILSIVKIIAGILLMIVFPVLQFRKFKQESYQMQIFMLYAILHIIEILIVVLFCDMLSDSSRYLFTTQFLLYAMSAHYIYKYLLSRKMGITQHFTVFAMALFLIPTSFPKLVSFIGYNEKLSEKQVITDHLKEKGLSFGYATFWNAYINTFYSSGEVEINGISIDDKVHPYYWLTSMQRYTQEAHQGSTFLLLTEEENDLFTQCRSYSQFGEPIEYEWYKGYYIYIYDYNISLSDFGGKDFNDVELLDRMICDDAASTDSEILLDLDSEYLISGQYINIKPSGSNKF